MFHQFTDNATQIPRDKPMTEILSIKLVSDENDMRIFMSNKIPKHVHAWKPSTNGSL